ncbi:hypothetical protein RCCS2_12154 [Roseobacter sp. CCS2]|nr:hypothetical protein RCCS2_12154 [Roseobacter sp. CCS2]
MKMNRTVHFFTISFGDEIELAQTHACIRRVLVPEKLILAAWP